MSKPKFVTIRLNEPVKVKSGKHKGKKGKVVFLVHENNDNVRLTVDDGDQQFCVDQDQVKFLDPQPSGFPTSDSIMIEVMIPPEARPAFEQRIKDYEDEYKDYQDAWRQAKRR